MAGEHMASTAHDFALICGLAGQKYFLKNSLPARGKALSRFFGISKVIPVKGRGNPDRQHKTPEPATRWASIGTGLAEKKEM